MVEIFSRYAPAAQEIAEQGVPDIELNPDYYNDFWETQAIRCIQGYEPKKGDWISGDFYFHLNFTQYPVINEQTGKRVIERPPYTDLDHEIFQFFYDCEKDKVGAYIIKGRRMHFTTDVTSTILNRWNTRPGITMGVGAYGSDPVEKIRQNIIVCRSALPAEMQYEAIDTKDHLIQEEKVKSANGWKKEGTFARILFRIFGGAKLGVGAFRGEGLDVHVIDEIGENPELLDCLEASRECWKEGEIMTGLPILGGTANNMKNPSPDLEQFNENPEAHGFRKLFLPRQKWYYPYVDYKTGKADEKKAKSVLETKAQELYLLPNKTSYWTFLQENPTEESHCFMGDSNSAELPLDKINDQIKRIAEDKTITDKIRIMDLQWKKGQYDPKAKLEDQLIVSFTNPKGEYKTFADPANETYKGLDIAGIDTYFKDGAPNSDSIGVMYVYRRMNPYDSSMLSDAPIAEYAARYKTVDEFYDGCLKLAVYYNCLMLAEYDQAFLSFMKSNNALKYFAPKPTAGGLADSVTTNHYMLTMSGSIAPALRTSVLRDYLNRFAQNIPFIKLLEDLRRYKPGKTNTDYACSFGIALILNMDQKSNLPIDLSAPKRDAGDFMPTWERDANGNVVAKFFRNPEQKRIDYTQSF